MSVPYLATGTRTLHHALWLQQVAVAVVLVVHVMPGMGVRLFHLRPQLMVLFQGQPKIQLETLEVSVMEEVLQEEAAVAVEDGMVVDAMRPTTQAGRADPVIFLALRGVPKATLGKYFQIL